jgi:3-hydroxyisobutyrate dehydrogenase-like beta-hydroxyacid dehydrogenase
MSNDQIMAPRADISVLGLGAMGAAVANCFLMAGLRVAVWNRTPDKIAPLVAKGAEEAATVEDALRAAPITLVILSDAKAACQVLGAIDKNLSYCTIVNFSSGTTSDSLVLRQLVENAGGRYLRGTITAYPRNVGNQSSCFFYSGDPEAFINYRFILDHLSGGSLFLSDAEASALGAAMAIQSFVAMGGFYEAVAAATKLGAEKDSFATNLQRVSRFLFLDAIDDGAQRIRHDNFGGEQATINTHIAAIEGLLASFSELEIATPLLEAFLSTAKRAKALGYGNEDIAAASKAFAL